MSATTLLPRAVPFRAPTARLALRSKSPSAGRAELEGTGAWWPRSRDPSHELSALADVLDPLWGESSIPPSAHATGRHSRQDPRQRPCGGGRLVRVGAGSVTGSTVRGPATPEHTAKHSAFPPRPDPAGTHLPDKSEASHDRFTDHQEPGADDEGRITEELGRVTRNRRLQRRGRTDRVSGSLKQAAQKAMSAFSRSGSDPR
ncbi:DUF5994 family protein [Streptomyces sp. NPDC127178]|uniref:DUF5994 family protein n=1 Tax=unclassified Streptomyces TaxID=2593676 RepID=UPI003635134B